MERLKTTNIGIGLVGALALSACSLEMPNRVVALNDEDRRKYEISEDCKATLPENIGPEDNSLAVEDINPNLLSPDGTHDIVKERTNSLTVLKQDTHPEHFRNLLHMLGVFNGFEQLDSAQLADSDVNVNLHSNGNLPFSAEDVSDIFSFVLHNWSKLQDENARNFMWCLSESFDSNNLNDKDLNVFITSDPNLCFGDLGLVNKIDERCRYSGFAPPPFKLEGMVNLELGNNIYIAPGYGSQITEWSDLKNDSDAQKKITSTIIHEFLHVLDWNSGNSIAIQQVEDTVYETTDHFMWIAKYDERARLPLLVK